MKKIAKILIIAIFLLTILSCIVACDISKDDTNQSASKKTISYYVQNGDNWDLYVKTRFAGNSLLSFPDEPKMSGYVFYGWYESELFVGNEVLEYTYLNKPLDSDLKLYAKFVLQSEIKSSYSLKLKVDDEQTINLNVAFKSSIPNEYLDIKKDGYVFKGWYQDSNFTKVWNVQYDKIKKDTTLYALFDEGKYEITYNLNGGVNNPNNLNSISPSDIFSVQDPTKNGYEFKGWFVDEEFNTAFDKNGQKLNSNLTLYAKWQIIQYTIELNVNNQYAETYIGETSISYTVEDDLNTLILNPTPKPGYDFKGWYFNLPASQGGGEEKLNFDNYQAKDYVLNARFEEHKFTITYHLDGGVNSNLNKAFYKYFDLSIELNDPEKEGYTFGGWYLDESFDTIFDGVNRKENIDVFAKFNIITYNITYHIDGYSYTPTILTFNVNDRLNIPSIEKENYIFIGWYLDADFTAKLDPSKSYSRNLDLYPRLILSELFDEETYIVLGNEKSLMLEQSEDKNVCIYFNEPIHIETSSLDSDLFVSVIENNTTMLIIKREAFTKSVGIKYPFNFVTSDNVVLDYYMTLVNNLPYSITLSDYIKNNDTPYSILLSEQIPENNILAVTIDGKKVDYTFENSEEILISTSYMNTLLQGRHIIKVFTSQCTIKKEFKVSNTSDYYPYNLKIDIDSDFPNVYITWDCDKAPTYFVVDIDGDLYSSANLDYAALFDGYSFNAMGKLKVSGQKVKVTAYKGGEYTSEEITFKYNLYTSKFSNTYASGVERFLSQTFSVYGVTGNYFITSWIELYDMLFFMYLYRDIIPTRTFQSTGLGEVTAPSIQYCIDFDINSCSQIRLNASYYSSLSSSQKNLNNNDFVGILIQEVFSFMPEAVSYSLFHKSISSYSFLSSQTYMIDCIFNGAYTPDSDNPRTVENYTNIADNYDYLYNHYARTQDSISTKYGSNYQFPREKDNKGVVRVKTSTELYLALERGYYPQVVNAENPNLYLMYNRMKTKLKDIISDEMNEYEIALAIYDYLSSEIVYDYSAVDECEAMNEYDRIHNTNTYVEQAYGMTCYYMEGVFLYNLAVCNGISAAYSAMLNMMGISAHKITGNVSSGAHAWIELNVGGEWYLSDATWGNGAINDSGKKYEYTSYRYFLMSDRENILCGHNAKPIPYEHDYAGDMSINVFKNIKFEYNSNTYNFYIESNNQLKALLNCVINNANLTSGKKAAVQFYFKSNAVIESAFKSEVANAIASCNISSLQYSVSYVVLDIGNVAVVIKRN